MKDVVIKNTKEKGKGLFAAKNIEKGEIVNKWRLKFLNETAVKKLNDKQKNYVYQVSKTRYLYIQSPERYVNHSCDPNTEVKKYADVAIRFIKKGEEITSDYGKTPGIIHFQCECGSKNCKGYI